MNNISEYLQDARALEEGELKNLAKASIETLFLYDFYTDKPFSLSENGRTFSLRHVIPMKLENIRALRDFAHKQLLYDKLYVPFNIQEPQKTPGIQESMVITNKKDLFRTILNKKVLSKDLEARLKKFHADALKEKVRFKDKNVSVDDLVDLRNNFEEKFGPYRSWIADGVDLRVNIFGGKNRESIVYSQEKQKRAISLTNKFAKEAYKAKTKVGANLIMTAENMKKDLARLDKDGFLKGRLPTPYSLEMYMRLAQHVAGRDKRKKTQLETNPFIQTFTRPIKNLAFSDALKYNLLSQAEIDFIADMNLSKISLDDYFGFMIVTPFGYSNSKTKELDAHLRSWQRILACDSRYEVMVKEDSYRNDPSPDTDKYIRSIHLAVRPSESFVYDVGKELSNILPHPRHFSEDDLSSLSFSVHLQGLLDKYDAEFGPNAHDLFKANSDPFRMLDKPARKIMDKEYFGPLSTIVMQVIR
ncbi:hypothetical protein K9M74_00735 [Candidatus Woesearchaeota archaeon]|nr:hypothetical protein [Candidatus Woesearchaeota archaeon]